MVNNKMKTPITIQINTIMWKRPVEICLPNKLPSKLEEKMVPIYRDVMNRPDAAPVSAGGTNE